MYLEKWILLILIYVIGLIGYTLGEDNGYMRGWTDRSKKNKYIDEEEE